MCQNGKAASVSKIRKAFEGKLDILNDPNICALLRRDLAHKLNRCYCR